MEPKSTHTITAKQVEDLIFNFTRRAFHWANFPMESIEILCKITQLIPMNAFYREYDIDRDVLVFIVPPFADDIRSVEIKELQKSSTKLLTK